MKSTNRHFIPILLVLLMISAVARAVMADDLVCIRCVDTTDINYDAVTSNRILDGSVRTADLGIDAVTSPRIKNGEVRTADLAANAVTSSKILNGTIREYDLADGAVTRSKLDNEITDDISELKSEIAALRARVSALEAENTAHKEFLDFFSFEELDDPSTGNSYPTVRVTGANLQVVNGLNYTNMVNGTGNLIVGYNQGAGKYRCSDGQYDDETSCTDWGAIWSDTHRSGSHNIVTGEGNNYSQYGGLITGYDNTINRNYASVSGGLNNTAGGSFSSVSGGQNNTASGYASSVSGGQSNTASGQKSSIPGGESNTASGFLSSVSGGYQRSAAGEYDWSAGSLFEDF